MSEETIKSVEFCDDGVVYTVGPEGRHLPVRGQTDWEALSALGEAEVEAAAEGDHDAPPVSASQLKRAHHAHERVDVKTVRERQQLSLSAFAEKYSLSIDTVQGTLRAQPLCTRASDGHRAGTTGRRSCAPCRTVPAFNAGRGYRTLRFDPSRTTQTLPFPSAPWIPLTGPHLPDTIRRF